METMIIIDWGIKILCTAISLVIVFRFKNQILELLKEATLRENVMEKRSLEDMKKDIEHTMDRVIQND